ncbi:MAG: hypothetical protein WCS35_04570 [Sphaerochaeta sp.]
MVCDKPKVRRNILVRQEKKTSIESDTERYCRGDSADEVKAIGKR